MGISLAFMCYSMRSYRCAASPAVVWWWCLLLILCASLQVIGFQAHLSKRMSEICLWETKVVFPGHKLQWFVLRKQSREGWRKGKRSKCKMQVQTQSPAARITGWGKRHGVLYMDASFHCCCIGCVFFYSIWKYLERWEQQMEYVCLEINVTANWMLPFSLTQAAIWPVLLFTFLQLFVL